MSNSLLGNKVVAQIGIIVKDIEKTSAAYAKFLGVEKPAWVITGAMEEAHTEYQGKPSKARAKLAFFELENIQLELIEPDQEPSTWREFLDTHGEGVHHIAFIVKGMQEKINILAQNNFPLIQKGDYTGGCYSYIDTTGDLKVILELLENFE
ncbi:MAG TPA: VOC family protein [Bacillota bacterium]|nr:VOC family protein [Bacillota bacterium]